MLEELAQLRMEYWALLVVSVAATTRTAALFWWKVRQADRDLAFKKELLEQQFSIDEVVRLVQSGKPRRRVVIARAPASADAQFAGAPPAAVEVPGRGASFGEWYKQRFTGIPLVAQLLMWFIYGFAWILLWYALSTLCRNTVDAARNRPGSGFFNFAGAALFVATLFASISLLVHVASSDSRRRPAGEMLRPEGRVVPLAPGGEASCRILIGHDFFLQGETLELTALVVSQSNPAGKLRVQINPNRYYLFSASPGHVTVALHSLVGTGDFTVQISAGNRLNRRAETIFTVQVRPTAAAGPCPPLDNGPPAAFADQARPSACRRSGVILTRGHTPRQWKREQEGPAIHPLVPFSEE